MKKRLVFLLLFMLLLCGCDKKEYVTKNKLPDENPIVTMSIKGYGDIKVELYPDKALNTVANFISLIENGIYDNNAITRVQKGFVVQAGALKTVDYTIAGEFKDNGYNNTLSHEEGVISMARTTENNSASTQFFIVLDDSAKASLDGMYAGFGKVIEGMDIIHKIEDASFEFDNVNAPLGYGFLKENEYITIEKTTVDTKGYNYKVNKLK